MRYARRTSDGTKAIVLHISDYTLVTDTLALRPEYAFIYATRLGPTCNEPATASAAPVSPLARTVCDVHLRIGGVLCDMQFAGLAPGFEGYTRSTSGCPTAFRAAYRT